MHWDSAEHVHNEDCIASGLVLFSLKLKVKQPFRLEAFRAVTCALHEPYITYLTVTCRINIT